jgi:hypothetical protein
MTYILKYLLYISIIFSASFSFGQSFKIIGSVVDKQNNKQIRGVKLSLFNENDSILSTNTSDKKGNFIFTDLKPGVYSVLAYKKKYSKARTYIKLSDQPILNLKINLQREIKFGPVI